MLKTLSSRGQRVVSLQTGQPQTWRPWSSLQAWFTTSERDRGAKEQVQMTRAPPPSVTGRGSRCTRTAASYPEAQWPCSQRPWGHTSRKQWGMTAEPSSGHRMGCLPHTGGQTLLLPPFQSKAQVPEKQTSTKHIHNPLSVIPKSQKLWERVPNTGLQAAVSVPLAGGTRLAAKISVSDFQVQPRMLHSGWHSHSLHSQTSKTPASQTPQPPRAVKEC